MRGKDDIRKVKMVQEKEWRREKKTYKKESLRDSPLRRQVVREAD